MSDPIVIDRPRPRRGLYENRFWEYVAAGELRLQRSSAGRFRYPPSAVDPETLDPQFAWVPIRGTGTLLAWTVFHRQYFPGMPTPYVVAAVRTTEGPILIANVVEAGPDDLIHDMQMVLRYEAVISGDEAWQIFQWAPAADAGPAPSTATKESA